MNIPLLASLRVGEVRGRGSWERFVGEVHGRGSWERFMGEVHGTGTESVSIAKYSHPSTRYSQGRIKRWQPFRHHK
jgi:hypothetical protein